MSIDKFAESHRLKVTREDCLDGIPCYVIKGRLGQIYEYGDGVLGVLFMPDEKNAHHQRSYARKWGVVRDACVAVGMNVVQQGDAEGALTFDPRDKAQVRQAIKAARIKTRREASPAQLAVLAAARASQSRQIGRTLHS